MKFSSLNLKEIVQMMNDHHLSEFNFKEGRKSIKIKRDRNAVQKPADMMISDPTTQLEKVKGNVSDAQVSPQATLPNSNHLHEIKTPLVGTFYRSSSPDDQPYVNVGDPVNNNDTLCIIEAMKSMNEIKADTSGVIKEIIPNNGEMVEYNQVLFRIEESS